MPAGKRRFECEGDKVFQNSMVEDNLRWEVVQTIDTIDPTNKNKHYNAKSALAKTVRFNADGKLAWGDLPKEGEKKVRSCE